MSQRVEKEMTVLNELGLHARPAAEFVRCANQFKSTVKIRTSGGEFSAVSITEVLIANLDQGAVFTVMAEGPDAEKAVSALEEIIRRVE